MKKIVLPLALLALLGGQVQAQGPKRNSKAAKTETAAPRSLPLGAAIPLDGIMLDAIQEGPEVSLREAKTAKGLLVMFSCNTCPFVVKAQPKTREAMELSQKLGIGMVIINSNQAQRNADDSREAMMNYARQQDYKVPYIMDIRSQLADAFGATRTPEVFLFNGDGKLVYKGALEDNPGEPGKSQKFFLNDALNALDQHKPINPAETKSIGCSIKRMES